MLTFVSLLTSAGASVLQCRCLVKSMVTCMQVWHVRRSPLSLLWVSHIIVCHAIQAIRFPNPPSGWSTAMQVLKCRYLNDSCVVCVWNNSFGIGCVMAVVQIMFVSDLECVLADCCRHANKAAP